MLKKPLATLLLLSFTATLLTACVSEPRDPAFAGAEAVDEDEASKTRVSLGLTYLRTGDFTRAKANLDKALEFAPRSANANFAMAYYYQQVDEIDLADDYYNRAIRYDSDNADIINSYGAFLCEQGDYKRAKSYFLKAVNNKSYISTAETYENLAICAQSQGLPQEALGHFQSALNHQPTRGRSLFLLAQQQAELGDYVEAKKTLWKYDRIARVSPQSLWLSYQIAKGLGDTQAALGYGEILKSMFPDDPNTRKFKEEMGEFQPTVRVTSKRKIQLPVNPVDISSTNAANAAVVTAAENTTQASLDLLSDTLVDSIDEPITVDAETVVVATTKDNLIDKPTDNPTDNITGDVTDSATQTSVDLLGDEQALSVDVSTTVDVANTAAVTTSNSLSETATQTGTELPSDEQAVIVEAPTTVDVPTTEAIIAAVESRFASASSAQVEKTTKVIEPELSAADSALEKLESENKIDTQSQAVVEQAAEVLEGLAQTVEDTAEQLDDMASDENYAAREAELEAAFLNTESEPKAETVAEDGSAEQAATNAIASTNDVTSEALQDALFHVVAPKENLYQISLRYNVKMKYLMQWNDLEDASSIRIGTKLRVKDPNTND
ncbi:type IV pilus biogenesis/stability protein PilW [Glaciecola sp. MH2013]|uniref:type IV pilus biogenesis/stability protein PilW n=1 Tax=Glaciecola sp. MH2013 TaxID=2785524 RepID=UPI001E326A19|nr:type IV pilus biogenesis/stability protein PilW [Glaciecola sp. MH2013]